MNEQEQIEKLVKEITEIVDDSSCEELPQRVIARFILSRTKEPEAKFAFAEMNGDLTKFVAYKELQAENTVLRVRIEELTNVLNQCRGPVSHCISCREMSRMGMARAHDLMDRLNTALVPIALPTSPSPLANMSNNPPPN